MRIKSALSVLGVCCLTLVTDRARAAGQWIWDPSHNNGTTAASGGWDTTAGNTVWYNGSSDVLWSQTSTVAGLNGAVFNGPDAAPGTYAISLDGVQIAPTNLIINNNGYIFTTPTTNDVYIPANDVLSVAANKTVTFNCPMGGNGTQPAWELGSGATMNVGGNIINAQQLRFGGAAGSAFNLTGNSSIAIPWILGPAINITAGSFAASGNFFIGYFSSSGANGSLGYTAGTLTVSGSGTVSDSGGIFIIARGGGQGTLVVQSGGTVDIGVTKAEPLAINYDGNAASVATVNVQGGLLQVGTSSFASQVLFFDSGVAQSGSTAILNQSGGTISAWGGIVLGNGGGVAGSVATLTQNGGILDVGPSGITAGGSYSGSLNIYLSGGTIGDLAAPGWSSSLPMTLSTTNGNISFAPANTITLSGALTGGGGLNVTGGTLALTGADNYSGSTGVSTGGTLAVSTGSSPISGGSVTLDASTGSPTLVVNGTPGDSWSIGGGLAFQNGATALSFQFSSLPPSPSVAPIQVTGNVAFTSTPTVAIGGTEIANGTYPLITYTGSISGTMPTTVTTWTGSASAGTISNNAGNKTIYLVVTSSSITAPVYWHAASSAWNFGSPNWLQSSAPADYSDGDAVIFDDTATGSSPITVTLNTTVNPASVTFNNSAKSYIITGSGDITGSGTLSVLGSGTNTLADTNDYSGGTTISAGQLNINNGGTGSASPIGTGTLTINGGTIDNTSGSDVTLQPTIPENWNGNFAYLGSANNFNTGSGGVTLNANIFLNVNANDLAVPGAIFDNFVGYQVTKTGSGTLTLSGNNNIAGVTHTAGQLNLGSATAVGANLTINAPGGCKIDNTSGSPLTLTGSTYAWTTGFEFVGSTNLDFGTGTVTGNTDPLSPSVTVDGNAVMSTEGQLNFGNVSINKYGTGTWNIGGTVGNSVGFFVYAGELQLNKSGAQSVNGHLGLNVYTSGLVQDEQDFQMHSDTHGSPQTVTLQGGTWDLQGFRENVDILALSSSGTLQDSSPVPGAGTNAGISTLTSIQGLAYTLSGLCHVQVDDPTGILNIKGSFSGDGTETMVKTGPGTVNLFSNNVYTGSTVISNGTIGLAGAGSLASSVINLAVANAALDLTSNNSTTLTLQSGQTLSGIGTVTGMVMTVSGATIAPGSTTVGTLTLNGAGANTLNGTTKIKLDKGNANNDLLSVTGGGTLAYGGTLSLTNLTGTLAAGDTFTIFNATSYSGAFTSITPYSPGYGLQWDTSQLTTSGTIGIIAVRAAHFTPTLVSGVNLTLNGTNGTTNGTYRVFTSTNLSIPASNWVQVGTGSFDSVGHFSYGVTNTNNAAQFFILKEP